MALNGHPLPIVTQNEETQLFDLDEAALASVLLRPDVADGPVCVVAVAGAFRKGKTFLLDFLLRYCANMGGDNWLGDNSNALQGFRWKQGYKRETTGILIWSEPFLIERDNGEKIAVILMDTQGTFDLESTLKDSIVVFALSLLSSSVLVYNLMSNIQEDDLMNLQTFLAYGTQALHGFDDSSAYQKLLFLVRDWGFSAQLPYGAEGGKRLLDDILQVKAAQPASHQELRADVRRCFENISCYLMPHPGFKAQENAGFSGKLCELEDQFVKHLKLLVPLLLAPENLVVKRLGGHAITAKDLFAHFKSFVEVFRSSDLPEPTTLAESMAQANSQTAMAAGLELYAKNMREFLARNFAVQLDLLDTEHERMKEEAVNLYQQRNTLGRRNERICQQFQEQLESDISALYNGEFKPLGSSQCALEEAKQQYGAAMDAVAGDGRPAPEMDELRVNHEAAKEQAIQFYRLKNVIGKNNEAIYDKYLELLAKELNERYDVDLMPRASSTTALLACKTRYAETMNGLFLAEPSTPTVSQLRDRHTDGLKDAIADYRLRNELARKNPEIFEEYQRLLEEELDRLHATEYVPRASSHWARRAAMDQYEEAMRAVVDDDNSTLDMGQLKAEHEAKKQRAFHFYEQKNELAKNNNQSIHKMYLELLEKEMDSQYNGEYKPLVCSRCAMLVARQQYVNALGAAAGAAGPVLQMDALRAKHEVEKEQAIQCYHQRNTFGQNNEAIREKYLERLIKAIDKVFDEDLMARSSSQAAQRACKRRYVEVMDGLFVADGPTMDELRTKHDREKERALADYEARNLLGTKNSATFTEFLNALEMEINKAFTEEYQPRASSVAAVEASRQQYIRAMQHYVEGNAEGVDTDDLRAAHDRERQNAIDYYLSENKLSENNQVVLKEYQKLLEQELERLFQASLKLNAAKREFEESKTQAKRNALWKSLVYLAGTAGLTALSPTAGIAFATSAVNGLNPEDCSQQEKEVAEAKKKYEAESMTSRFKNLFRSGHKNKSDYQGGDSEDSEGKKQD